MSTYQRVMVLGLDGLEPTIVDRLFQRGELPHLARLREHGGYSRVATTAPAQTPVAWSSFATGTNPGGHGIFDFLRSNRQTHFPDISLYQFEQKNAFVPPKVVNLRRGVPVWRLLSDAGISSTVIRCPCTFPPDEIRGKMISGMGVPDLRGTFSTATLYTSNRDAQQGESEIVVHLPQKEGTLKTHLVGPRNPKTGANCQLEITLKTDTADKSITILSGGQPSQMTLKEGEWSDWVTVKIKTGMLQSVRGMVRFLLVRLQPELELYASPINFDPEAPRFPISSPPDYAAQLARETGTFYTTGMVEDHGGLNNERFDENTYLHHCNEVMRERERMMLHELMQFKQGFFYCLFDTPDRLQHMFWRFQEADHPANKKQTPPAEMQQVIEEHYRQCDKTVGRALEFADDKTLFVVLSDHGFSSFQRGVHLNSWLHQHGLLKMKPGCQPGKDAESFFQGVDWPASKAYALGLSSIYLNVRDREADGGVSPDEADSLKAAIAEKLPQLEDPKTCKQAVRSVALREKIYSGPYAEEAPDLVVNFEAGYRVSWSTALGGVPEELFEDNVKKWSGDHIIDPALVPGALFMNRSFHQEAPRLVDLAPTILHALGVSKGKAMEGRTLLR